MDKFARFVQLQWLLPLLGMRKAFPDGHFYSPVANTRLLRKEADRVWPEQPAVPGIDFNEPEQLRWIAEVLPRHLPAFDYPEHLSVDSPGAFHMRNSQFSGLDALLLFSVLRELAPKRMIEVGSGFSSLLTADVNTRFLGGTLDFTCIDPLPRRFLRDGLPGIRQLIPSRVQDVPMDLYSRLQRDDILFIDSSHVAKTGSDVNHLCLQVLPRLATGVVVHIHDIFLPNDYPREWVLGEGRGWNEQYLVQALLVHSNGFEVLFGCAYAQSRLAPALRQALGDRPMGGASLWLRRRA